MTEQCSEVPGQQLMCCSAGPSVQIKEGESFQTQTDTEVIPKLCKVVYERAKVVDSRVSFFEVPPSSPPICTCPLGQTFF